MPNIKCTHQNLKPKTKAINTPNSSLITHQPKKLAPSKNLSTQQRTQIMQKMLYALNNKGKPVLGTINALAT